MNKTDETIPYCPIQNSLCIMGCDERGCKREVKASPLNDLLPKVSLSENFFHRQELMRQLDTWENNNPDVAQDIAKALVNLIRKQFNLD